MAERKFFSGKTLEQALLAAARHYQIEPEELAYSTRDKKHGFLKIGRKVVIETDPSNPKKTAQQVAESSKQEQTAEVRQPRFSASRSEGIPPLEGSALERKSSQERRVQQPDEERIPVQESQEPGWWEQEETVDDDLEAVDRAIQQVAELAGLEVSWSIEEQDEGVSIEFEGEDADYMVDEGGKMLYTLEHLLPRVVRGWRGHGIPCKVDCEGFRANHEEELSERARDIAAKVLTSQTELSLEPMNPADRRIVHLALADLPEVETESDGHGFMKRVRVIPASEQA